MNFVRYGHIESILSNGKILVAGGASNGVLNSTEVYDPSTGTWTTTGNMNVARMYHTSSILLNGKILVAGGMMNGAFLNSTELY
jgi:N-acetylneuraminic acid mutarotase